MIILGMIIGVVYGLLASNFGWIQFTTNWVKPFGSIFINLLKLVAVPLVIVTIIGGITSLSDTTNFFSTNSMVTG
uniref:cation:dicarboxylate symporter family transporter n=1 Tax=Roseivirga sp. TaxID=1964215 RepID=UPI004047E869